jgi:hypothetical protein
MQQPAVRYAARLAAYSTAATHLSLLSDRRLAAFLRAWVAGQLRDNISPEIVPILDRHARSAVILDEFHRRLLEESKQTPFPATEIEWALRPYARARSRG